MNGFDKLCGFFAGLLGVVLLVFGILGTFTGVKLWLELPPVIAVVVAFAGWGILRSIYLAWNLPSRRHTKYPPEPSLRDDDAGFTNWDEER